MGFEIIVAKKSSFCPGVKRAVRIAREILSKENPPVYSTGPLIHNPQFVAKLKTEGLLVLEELPKNSELLRGLTLITRSHGIDRETHKSITDAGARVIDATCPKVKRVQKAAGELVRDGYSLIILGSPEHPEVRAIASRASKNALIFSNASEATKWFESEGKKAGKVGVVCQTTVAPEVLDEFSEFLKNGKFEIVIRDTICEDVRQRIKEAEKICKNADVMIVVGGKNSSNTKSLTSICSTYTRTYHVERPSEIKPSWFKEARKVGVTGGASTPSEAIEETTSILREISKNL